MVSKTIEKALSTCKTELTLWMSRLERYDELSIFAGKNEEEVENRKSRRSPRNPRRQRRVLKEPLRRTSVDSLKHAFFSDNPFSSSIGRFEEFILEDGDGWREKEVDKRHQVFRSSARSFLPVFTITITILSTRSHSNKKS